jgi:uncharacterized protein
MPEAIDWIHKLGLQKHPEGGWFAETYRSLEIIPASGLPGRFGGPRNLATAIYFLLKNDERSRLHRLQADEIWHFYAGSPIILHIFDPQGSYSSICLGPDPDHNEVQQAVVLAGSWFGAHLLQPNTHALMGCTVSPGFDFQDFELGQRQDLFRLFPEQREIIEKLTS